MTSRKIPSNFKTKSKLGALSMVTKSALSHSVKAEYLLEVSSKAVDFETTI